MSSSRPIYGTRQSIRGCNAPPLNWRDNLSRSSRWASHGNFTNVYGYTMDKNYGES